MGRLVVSVEETTVLHLVAISHVNNSCVVGPV